MSEVKRFVWAGVHGMAQQENGKWVNYEDYAALQQKLDAALAENALIQITPSLAAMMEALDAFYEHEDLPETGMLAAHKILLPKRLPLTDAYLNSVRAEGIHFAANRMLAAWDSGFIDETPAQAYDISGAVLSAVEFLPNASPEEFKRDFADEIRREIKSSTADAAKDGV